MRDLLHQVKVTPCINPGAAITSNAAVNGAIIDNQGYEGLVFVLQSGTITDGAFAVKIEEGDDSGLSDAADATALIGTAAAASFAATDDNKVKMIGYRGSKRYCRVVATQSGATSGGILGAVAVQGFPRQAPAGGGITP